MKHCDDRQFTKKKLREEEIEEPLEGITLKNHPKRPVNVHHYECYLQGASWV